MAATALYSPSPQYICPYMDVGKTNRALKQCGKEGSDGRSRNEVK
jgi:hypothetical protein